MALITYAENDDLVEPAYIEALDWDPMKSAGIRE
jgi:hypothetical protein